MKLTITLNEKTKKELVDYYNRTVHEALKITSAEELFLKAKSRNGIYFEPVLEIASSQTKSGRVENYTLHDTRFIRHTFASKLARILRRILFLNK